MFFSETALPKWTEIWWEAPMEGSVLRFLKAEWKVSDTGSAHWASSFRCIDHFICYSHIVYIGDSLGHVTNHTLVVDLDQRDCVNLNTSTDLEPRKEVIVLSQVGADFPIDELCISKSLLLNLPGKEEGPKPWIFSVCY
jgi:hypothetical protein